MVPGCLEFQTPGYSMIFFWRMDMDGFLYTFDGVATVDRSVYTFRTNEVDSKYCNCKRQDKSLS